MHRWGQDGGDCRMIWVTILVAGGCLLMHLRRRCCPAVGGCLSKHPHQYASCEEGGLDDIRAGYGQGEDVWEDRADRPVTIYGRA